MSVSRGEQQLAWREDHMKQEVADVQKVKCLKSHAFDEF